MRLRAYIPSATVRRQSLSAVGDLEQPDILSGREGRKINETPVSSVLPSRTIDNRREEGVDRTHRLNP